MSSLKKELKCGVAQCDSPLDQNYWNAQWASNKIGWDVGNATPAITNYLAQYTNKTAAIFIPGCGSAHEAEYLLQHGFTNVTLIDIAPNAVESLSKKFAGAAQVKVLCDDFFTHQGNYDLIIEQTFFCAIPPLRRKEYAQKAASLLNPNGKVIGLLFNRTFEKAGPPFGGSSCEYKSIFEPYFIIKKMEECHNSIAPRAGTEVFINFVKK